MAGEACMAGGCVCGGGHAWQGHVWQEGHVWQGVCMAGGHVWWGACIAGAACVAGEVCKTEGPCGRGHVWQGACVAGGVHGRRDGHCRGWYASYWNPFLLFKDHYTNIPVPLSVDNEGNCN